MQNRIATFVIFCCLCICMTPFVSAQNPKNNHPAYVKIEMLHSEGRVHTAMNTRIQSYADDSLMMMIGDSLSLKNDSLSANFPLGHEGLEDSLSIGEKTWLDSLENLLNADTIKTIMVDTIKPEPPKPIREEERISELHRYIRNYDVMRDKVIPRPALELPADTVLDYPRMSPLFLPLVFNARRSDYQLSWQNPQKQQDRSLSLISESRQEWEAHRYVERMGHRILQRIESERLDIIRYRKKDLPPPEVMEVHLDNNRPIRWNPSAIDDDMSVQVSELPKTKVSYSYWKVRGRLSNQITQTYISPNWSSGGASNLSGLVTLYWTASYDNKKIQFDNVVDAKLGFNTTSSDSLRKVNLSNDQIRMSSKLGIKAIQHWYYAVSAELITQLMNNYKANTYQLKSAFLSPAKFFISIGMDYKIENKQKGTKLSVLLTPLTYRMNYLRNIKDFKPSSYGIDEGKHLGHELGFKLSTTFDYRITEDISWNSYLYYYSDFSYVDSEWRNTLNLSVNEYLSTQLYIHMKLDDRAKSEEGFGLLQLKEYLSFGMTYYW